ncbi:MAG: hypothetical protein KGR70_16385 [Cyanobacteria bacterium REEB494]|nr:hypothetical protein [Cyanobacteria bacterium REEB494]
MNNQLVQRIKEDGQVTRAVFEYMDEVFEGQYGEEYSDKLEYAEHLLDIFTWYRNSIKDYKQEEPDEYTQYHQELKDKLSDKQ